MMVNLNLSSKKSKIIENQLVHNDRNIKMLNIWKSKILKKRLVFFNKNTIFYKDNLFFFLPTFLGIFL